MAQVPNPERILFPDDPEAMIFERQMLRGQQAPEICEIEKLMKQFDAHEDQEGEFLRQYQEIKEKSKNPLIKFLLQLIITDEEKHRATMHAIAATLDGDLTWTRPKDAFRGFGELHKDKENEELLELTVAFIQHEKEGIKDYKRLIKSSKNYYRGLFAMLLQTIIRDSEKHVEILEFLRQKLKQA